MKTTRVLPADVFDTLELSALAYGGIGAGAFFIYDGPCCIHGHAYEAEGNGDVGISLALRFAGIHPAVNDCAVNRINERKHKKCESRVSFAEWCEELGVVRGEA